MDLEKNKQRLEILATQVEELKNSGGGETVDAYTKAEADDKFAEKTNVYTKTEADNKFAEMSDLPDLNDYLTKAKGETLYISKNFPVIGGTIERGAIGNSNCIAIGRRKGSGVITNSTVFGNYDINRYYSINDSVLISSCGTSTIGNYTSGTSRSILIGIENTFTSLNNSIVISTGAQQNIISGTQLFYSTILGSYPELDNLFVNNIQKAFIVGSGSAFNAKKNTVEIMGENALRIDRAHLSLYNGADISFTSNSEFKVGSDTNSYDLRYFAPADETLTNGGTISATALANALKHVPLSFNAHMCYYSYEDNDNVYYTSTRLNGTSLHTNVVAINKTTGVATFNEFDQS